MNNSFLSKVAAERQVLAIVNAKFAGSRQLAGLSSDAIKYWQVKVAPSASERLVAALLVLGEVCQSLSNRSNESFKTLNPDVEARLEDALANLRITIEVAPH